MKKKMKLKSSHKWWLLLAVGVLAGAVLTSGTAKAGEPTLKPQSSLKSLTERFCSTATNQKTCVADVSKLMLIAATAPIIVRKCNAMKDPTPLDVEHCDAARQDYEQLSQWGKQIETEQLK